MATRNEYQPYDGAVANFKLWTSFIRNLFLTDAGWTQSSDTGQTNPTTIGATPTTIGSCYEIYKASDSLATASPLYVKVEYGTLGGATHSQGIAITAGNGSNGTGGITGAGYRWQFPGGDGLSPVGVTNFNMVGSGDSSSVRFILWRDMPASYSGAVGYRGPAFFAIERGKDVTGSDIPDFFTAFAYGCETDYAVPGNTQNVNAITMRQQTILQGGQPIRIEPFFWCSQTGAASAGFAGNVGADPITHFPGWHACQSKDLLCGKQNDFAEGGTYTLDHFGANHVFFATYASGLNKVGSINYAPLGSTTYATTADNLLLFRYE